MDFITVQELAEKWQVSVRQVQRLLAAERIPGAKKHGRVWLIPYDAAKPDDFRKEKNNAKIPDKRNEKPDHGEKQALLPMPLMNSAFEPGHARECAESFANLSLGHIHLAQHGMIRLRGIYLQIKLISDLLCCRC